jgi:hypothetical protein
MTPLEMVVFGEGGMFWRLGGMAPDEEGLCPTEVL